MRLSVLVPCYNERELVLDLLDLVANALPDVEKEIVLVDDGSMDGTRDILSGRFGAIMQEGALQGGEKLRAEPIGENATISIIFHDQNRGKGGAIQTAMRYSSGDVLIIQDADLEYDPADWGQMWDLIAERKYADVCYGSRFYGRPHRSLYYHHFLANRLISFIFNILYNQTLTDIEVCYKMFTRQVYESLRITQNDFGFEVQISAQIARHRNWRIYEMGISYYGRTYAAGKKINWKDGVKALWYLVKFRFVR
ncbi:MAG: glycosyltransferase family 2 protein [Amphiplicatus sp.]